MPDTLECVSMCGMCVFTTSHSMYYASFVVSKLWEVQLSKRKCGQEERGSEIGEQEGAWETLCGGR